MNSDYKKTVNKLLASDINGCRQFFMNNGYTLEEAYCNILEDNLAEAKRLFFSIEDKDIRAKWGVFLCGLISGKIEGYPSYFALRNFLEIDLNLLTMYYKGEYVENIVKYADWLYTINPEVHKFIGRVFLNNHLEEYGMAFLLKAKDYFYNDPELHYLLAEQYFKQNNIPECKKAIENCLNVLPEYFPAIQLQKKLKKNCEY